MSGRVFQQDKRATLFGMPLDLVTMDETVEACRRLVDSRKPAQHVVLNAGKVVLASRDQRLREIIGSADIVNADGQSVVWAGRLLGRKVPQRVTGIDLMHQLLAEAARSGWPVYFLGARKEVLSEAIVRLLQSHPTLIIAGSHHGYFHNDRSMAAAIRDSGAR
ncbi:MAG: WecB/TagA/CpsF family glycosyltransferase, partial [Coriobacteriia bacterium]|nr:WecB/TagA/CpsF family glycosyltransferase [Coriobacteriia bacterium]